MAKKTPPKTKSEIIARIAEDAGIEKKEGNHGIVVAVLQR